MYFIAKRCFCQHISWGVLQSFPKSAIHLAWLHKRPLLPLVGCGGWSDGPPSIPPDERKNSPILPWRAIAKLEANLRQLGLVKDPA
jgi:hypothetical protein